jgi:hypothetical protein
MHSEGFFKDAADPSLGPAKEKVTEANTAYIAYSHDARRRGMGADAPIASVAVSARQGSKPDSFRGYASLYDYNLGDADLIRCRSVTVEILNTWGDPNYAGLTGMCVLSGIEGMIKK